MNTDRRGFMKYLSGGAAAAGITSAMLQAEIVNKPAITEEFLKEQAETEGREFNYNSNNFDLVSWAVYDKLTIPAATDFDISSLSAFTHVQNAHGNFRGLEETNMYMPRMLPRPTMMRIERIFFLFNPANTLKDMATFNSRVVWEFIIGCKIYAQSTMAESNTKGRFSQAIRSNGYPTGLVPVDTLVLRPDLSLAIPQGMSFHMQFRSQTALFMRAPFSFHVFLDGIQARAVQ